MTYSPECHRALERRSIASVDQKNPGLRSPEEGREGETDDDQTHKRSRMWSSGFCIRSDLGSSMRGEMPGDRSHRNPQSRAVTCCNLRQRVSYVNWITRAGFLMESIAFVRLCVSCGAA